MIYFSKATGGFYRDDIHSEIPGDRVEITEEQHLALLKANSEGKVIRGDEEGFPVAVEPAKRPKTTRQQIAELEAAITPRRMREAVMGTDGGWLKAQEGKIAALRKRPKPESASK
ncbi:hypothetical protein TA3x_000483 [Tundrisphaera sp. TA3]|uniref:hypothetical protein n=1 Tax=Tundrisphaera sp. TA3 TaxID=3435775 RepID=UPI003EBB805F